MAQLLLFCSIVMTEKRVPRLADRFGIIFVYLTVQTLDIITTFVGLRRGASEANLLPRWLMDNYGESAMYGFKIVLVLAVLLIVVRLQHHFPTVWTAIGVVNALMLAVVAVNLVAIV